MSEHGSQFADLPFTFAAVDDDLAPGQRWSTWDDIGITAGPEPWPDWVITADAAIDTELGILKTGKEADVFLLERATDEGGVIMAAKRYRSHQDRLFHRDTGYQEGRRMRNTRDSRAAAKGTRWGRSIQAGEWTRAEFGYLADLWSAGLPVPYPVQLDGTEILMEFITVADGTAAPRLAQTRPAAPAVEQLLGTVDRRHAAAGSARADPWRPLGVQPAGRRRATGDHRPAPDGRRHRQPAGHGVPGPRLPERGHLVRRTRSRRGR